MKSMWMRWAARTTVRALLYAIIILLCVILAPEEPIRFIYTEF